MRLAKLVSTPSSPAKRRERDELLLAALQQLSPQHKEVLDLHYFGDLAISEIAPRIGKTDVATKALLARARNDLRKLLGRDFS